MEERWTWDPSLYAGAAPYYAQGRLPYPTELATVLQAELGLDGAGRLLDLGCGPGSLTLLLAPLFEEAVGLDADAGMIEEAARRAGRLGIRNVRWVCLRAEALPVGAAAPRRPDAALPSTAAAAAAAGVAVGRFRVVTLAQSFHWMDQPRVAAACRQLLTPSGILVHVGATTHRGGPDPGELPGPTPPRDGITALVATYLGSVRRAGSGLLPSGTVSREDTVLAAAGFVGPWRVTIPCGEVFRRSEDDVVASVFSLSSAAPHLFGDRLAAFEGDLRALLREVSPAGEFWERLEPMTLSLWSVDSTTPQPR